MKVAIITILDNTNFGTYLQALATGLVVKAMGHDVEILRYIRPFMTQKGYPNQILKERGFLSWLKHRNDINDIVELRNKDYAFLSEMLPITKEYTSFDALFQDPPMADIYLTGSDQVWNSVYNRGIDRSYYLDFAPLGTRKVAYAASIGMDSFPESEKDTVSSLFKKYNSITVRESAAQQILAQMGILSEVVLDPTLLLDSGQWSKIAKEHPLQIQEKYLLVYSVERKEQNELIEHYAIQIARKKGLSIYHVSYGDKRLRCADRFFGRATPEIFLGLMLSTDYVVVSSFHGTAFAINFNKPFITVSANRFNSRLQNLLETTCLQERRVCDCNVDVDTMSEIDYSHVNILLEEQRGKSLSRLREMLRY